MQKLKKIIHQLLNIIAFMILSKKILRTFVLSILLCASFSSYAQYPLEITIVLPPPYPTNLDDYESYLEAGLISINNSSNADVDAFFQASLKETSGRFSVSTDGITNESITFPPGQTLLSPTDIQDVFGGLTESDAIINGLSEEEKNAIIFNRQLPEGDYEICIHAFNELGVAISEPGSLSCFNFNAQYPERPIIVNPMIEEVLDTLGVITLTWLQVLNDIDVLTRTEYTLKIIDLTEQELNNPISAMFDPGVSPDFERKIGAENTVLLQNDIDLPLIVGHKYAARVTSSDPEGQIAYQFNGHSEVVTFLYGNPLDADDYVPPFEFAELTLPEEGEAIDTVGEINFEWEHLADQTLKDKYDYHFKFADLTSQNIDSIPRASLNSIYYLQEKTNPDAKFNFVSTPSARLIIGHKYGALIQIVQDKNITDSLDIPNNGIGEIVYFTYGEETLDPNECISDCIAILPDNPKSSLIKKGDVIFMGKFIMEVKSITNGNVANGYNGEGEIAVNFLNGVKVKVNFNGLKATPVGGHKQAFEGEADAVVDEGISNEAQFAEHLGAHIPKVTPEAAAEIRDAIKNGQKYLSVLSGKMPLTLPFGWDREVADQKMVVGITTMHFTAISAGMTALFSLEHPEWGQYIPSFGASDIVFSPDGFDKAVKLYLNKDFSIPKAFGNENDWDFTLKGIDESSGLSGCYIDIDCNGFSKGQISAEVQFPNDYLIPDSSDGEPANDHVIASFSGKYFAGNHFMLSANITDFQLPGLEGFSWKVNKATFDFSDMENPNFEFPESYEGYKDPNIKDTWKGFYIENMTMQAPQDWFGDGTRKAIELEDMLIDKSGVTGTFKVRNLVSINEGEIDGWAFSADTFHLSVVQNKFLEGGIAGRLSLPVMENGETLNYSSILDKSGKAAENKSSAPKNSTKGNDNTNDDGKFNFNLTVTPDDDGFRVPLFVADMTLFNTSYISINLSKADKEIKAALNGKISVSQNYLPQEAKDLASGLDIDMPGVTFEGLEFDTKKNFKAPTFSFASPQKKIGGFNMSIDAISMSKENDDYIMMITPVVSLVGKKNGISANSEVKFISQLEGSNFKLKNVSIGRMELEKLDVGAFSMEGYLEFYNDNTRGKGAEGAIKAEFPGGYGGGVNLVIGTYRANENVTEAQYNSTDYYNYWYLDGILKFGDAGIPVFNTPLSIYGFGGGAYYHMRKKNEFLPSSDGLFASNKSDMGGDIENIQTESSGVEYINDFNTLFGLKATAIIGASNPNALISDITLEAAFTNSGGVTLGLEANAFIMSDPLTKDASISATGRINVSNTSGSWVANADLAVYVNLAGGVIKGCSNESTGLMVQGNLHASSDYWHLYLGKTAPSDRGCLQLYGGVQIKGYFMAGHGLSTQLPELPPFIKDILADPSDEGLNTGDEISSSTKKMSRDISDGSPSEGKGFAFGASIGFNYSLDVPILYGRIQAEAGFDVNMTHMDNRPACGDILNPGINGWYANGQIYAGIKGELGLDVDLGFWSGEVELISAAAAMMLRGGGPNPIWVEGKVVVTYDVLSGAFSGRQSFDVKYGNRCKKGYDQNPFDTVKVIDEIKGTKDIYGDVYASMRTRLKMYEFKVGENKFKYVRPKVASFNVYKGNQSIPFSSPKLIDDNLIVKITPSDMLQPFTTYNAVLTIIAEDQFGSRIKDKNGNNWVESKEISFTTGARPTKITPDMLAYTVPLMSQRYFLQDENTMRSGPLNQRSGAIVFRSGAASMFDFKKYEYYARISDKMGANLIAYKKITKYQFEKNKKLKFILPNLINNKLYVVQIVRRDGFLLRSQNQRLAKQKVKLLERKNGNNINKVKQLDVNLNEGYGLSNETVLCSYIFGTSKYNNLIDKLNDTKGEFTVKENYFGEFLYNMDIKEPFDRYDMRGYTSPKGDVTKPLLRSSFTFGQKNGSSYYDYHYRQLLQYYGIMKTIVNDNPLQKKTFDLKRLSSYNNAYENNYIQYLKDGYEFENKTMVNSNHSYKPTISLIEYVSDTTIKFKKSSNSYDFFSASKMHMKYIQDNMQTLAKYYDIMGVIPNFLTYRYTYLKDYIKKIAWEDDFLRVNSDDRKSKWAVRLSYVGPGSYTGSSTVVHFKFK